MHSQFVKCLKFVSQHLRSCYPLVKNIAGNKAITRRSKIKRNTLAIVGFSRKKLKGEATENARIEDSNK